MHQITAYGGLKGKLPFQQAVLQSPGFQPYPGNWQQDQLLQAFLQDLGVSTIDKARSLPYETLQSANINLTSISPYGSFTFAPTVDGSFVPALPGKLILQGSYNQNLKLIVGHNANETAYFVDPTAVTLADQAAYGAGVYAGCWRERIISPVLPSIAWRPLEGLRRRRDAVGTPPQEPPGEP